MLEYMTVLDDAVSGLISEFCAAGRPHSSGCFGAFVLFEAAEKISAPLYAFSYLVPISFCP